MAESSDVAHHGSVLSGVSAIASTTTSSSVSPRWTSFGTKRSPILSSSAIVYAGWMSVLLAHARVNPGDRSGRQLSDVAPRQSAGFDQEEAMPRRDSEDDIDRFIASIDSRSMRSAVYLREVAAAKRAHDARRNAATRELDLADHRLRRAIAAARAAEDSWSAIGTMLGTSAQIAARKYGASSTRLEN